MKWYYWVLIIGALAVLAFIFLNGSSGSVSSNSSETGYTWNVGFPSGGGGSQSTGSGSGSPVLTPVNPNTHVATPQQASPNPNFNPSLPYQGKSVRVFY
jgi:hypothetical protein